MGTVLITGANGFVGRHLMAELTANKLSVLAIGGNDMADPNVPKNVDYISIDLTDPSSLAKIDLKAVDNVIHLAGLAAVGPSFENPLRYIDVNMGIEINLFEAAIKQQAKPGFLIISTGALYSPRGQMPITEESELSPSSPYAISKLGQEQLAAYYGTRGFRCVIARPFNHFGPGQGEGFIVPDFVKQAIDIERHMSKDIQVGNLKAKRDYTDVRDVVRAYRLLLEKGQPNETYNVCSGKDISGQQILEAILKETGVQAEIVQDKSKLRPTDADAIYGSYQKLNKATGWQPQIDFSQTIKDVVADWRTI